jgi:hypothetical protein
MAESDMRRLSAGEGSCKQRLERILVERVMVRVRAVAKYRQSLDELFEALRPAYLARRRAQMDVEIAILVEVLKEGAMVGEFKFEDAADTANDLVLATNAYLPYSLSVRELGQIDEIQAGLQRLSSLLVRGLSRIQGE